MNITKGDPRDMKRAILNPLAMGSRGRYVLLDGIQDNANLEDIVRHFEGFALMGNPVTLVREVRLPSSRESQLFVCDLEGMAPTSCPCPRGGAAGKERCWSCECSVADSCGATVISSLLFLTRRQALKP